MVLFDDYIKLNHGTLDFVALICNPEFNWKMQNKITLPSILLIISFNRK